MAQKKTETKKKTGAGTGTKTGGAKNNTKTKKATSSRQASAKKTGTAQKKAPAKKTSSQRGSSAQKQDDRELELIGKGESRRKNSGGFTFGEEVLILLTLAFLVIVSLGYFGLTGAIGSVINNVVFGLFGSAAFLFPFALFLIVVFLVVNHYSYASIMKSISIFLLFIAISMFFQLFVSADFESAREGLEGDPFYQYAVLNKQGGGFIGGRLLEGLKNLCGEVGAVIILITLALISFLMLTGKSLIRLITDGSREAVESVKDTAYDVYEELEERKYQKRREERRKRNIRRDRPRVDEDWHYMENTRLEEERGPGDEMHELLAEPYPEDMAEQPSHPVEERRDGGGEDLHEIYPEGSEIVLPMRRPVREVRAAEWPEQGHDPRSRLEDARAEFARMEREKNMGSFFPEEDPFSNEEAFPEAEPYPEPPRREPARQPERPAPLPEENTGHKRIVASASLPEGIRPNEDMDASDYQLPSLDLLKKGKDFQNTVTAEHKRISDKLVKTLGDFGVSVKVTDVSQGPTVTRYELLPDAGVKVSRILSLSDDIKLSLAAENIRIEAPVPGKSAVGIEVPNQDVHPVMLRNLLERDEFQKSPSKLAFAAGMDIGGHAVVSDIAKMPHLLIAGSTGSGKSVCMNTIIMSILFKARPDEVKLIMIDPKVVELSVYNGIPHLMLPVVTDPQKAVNALQWGVGEMEKRYKTFAELRVRKIEEYNQKAKELGMQKMYQLVIIVDELADLMMQAKGDVEQAIVRLAQKARAAGIHLIIATQRPSANVVTGLIKANMPSRIAFAVTSGIDSRIILDMSGAEKLLGKGDMLFYPMGKAKPARVQGAFVSDEEVSAVTDFVRAQNKEEEGQEEIMKAVESISGQGGSGASGSQEPDNAEDELFMDAADFVVNLNKKTISTGALQRKFRLGWNRAARIMEQLHDEGIVGDEAGTKGRDIIMTPEQFMQYREEHV